MLRKTIDLFRNLPGKSKKILGGLVRVGFREVVQAVPVVGTAARLLEELAEHGADRLADAAANLGDLKPAGQAFTAEQLAALDRWLEHLTGPLQGLQQRLEQL